MVTLEEGSDGVVTLGFLPPYGAEDEPAYLTALERIALRPAPFGLVTLLAGGGKLSPRGEREQALWFKRTRAQMNARCRGIAIVRPGKGEAMAAAFRRLWAFPIAMAASEDEARRFLLPLVRDGRP